MASPSASSTTLSIHSNEGESTVKLPRRWEVHGVTYDDDDNFTLSYQYTNPGNFYGLSPSMLAASNPDHRILKFVLENGNKIYNQRVQGDLAHQRDNGIPMFPRSPVGDLKFPLADMSVEFGPNSLRVIGGGDVGITTPLMEAIRSDEPENVRTLLEAGANPNGIPLHVMCAYAAFFLRFRPRIPDYADDAGDVASREELLGLMDLPQFSELTLEEVEDRFFDGMAPFWCEEGFTPNSFYINGESMPSLVAAAKCPTTEIFDQILAAGADRSFWMERIGALPEPPTESSLSVSSPLHGAIEKQNLEMVEHILDLGFDPNVMPLATPTRCYTPLMATVIGNDYFSREIFNSLASHPEIDFDVRTPVYNVHLLHFAVAKLDLEALKQITSKTLLQSAGVTALGHTLLHIACMPADSQHVQRHAEVIYNSVHETRDVSSYNDPHARFPPRYNHSIEYYENHFAAQTAIVQFLWGNGLRDIETRDVHGNTALHYLAGCKSMNWGLLKWLYKAEDGATVERAWKESKNDIGANPETLCLAAMKVRDEEKTGWCEWFERHYSRARAMRKEDIWIELLGNKCGGPLKPAFRVVGDGDRMNT